jgi:hypothetical protein
VNTRSAIPCNADIPTHCVPCETHDSHKKETLQKSHPYIQLLFQFFDVVNSSVDGAAAIADYRCDLLFPSCGEVDPVHGRRGGGSGASVRDRCCVVIGQWNCRITAVVRRPVDEITE